MSVATEVLQAQTRQAAPALQRLDCRWLFALYGVIPLALTVVAIDVLWLDNALRLNHLPTNPEYWPLWTIVFGLPHIVASLLTMADREYLAHYGRRLFWPMVAFTAVACAGVFGPKPVSQQLLFVLMAFYTIYHVLSQQLGLTLTMMGMPPTRTFKLWKWTAIGAGFAIYTIIFGRYELGRISLGPVSLMDTLVYVAGVLSAGVVALALRLTGQARHRIGAWYLWGNVALIVSAFLLMEINYSFFVIVMPRVIHDITAYMVYVTHDNNRNRIAPRNVIYRLTRFSRLPPLLLLPLLSVAVASALTTFMHNPLVYAVVVVITLLHYYFEGFIWRGQNPHRAQIDFRR
jgi:hypothetical protein